MDEAPSRILCVDDEPNVLSAFERTLGEIFDITTAVSGAAALEVMASSTPFAVIVSDMRMPGMDGAAFLARAAELAPHTSRVLLTGQTDIAAATHAINDGRIFRFLSKPCAPDELRRQVEDAVRQHQLVVAEKELLEKTLHGSVKVLSDVLGLVAPAAFSRAGQIRTYVAHAAKVLGLSNTWRFELAALLSQIGCVAIPPAVTEKVFAGTRLSASERQMFEAQYETGWQLISPIPRLEEVADMIRLQGTFAKSSTPPSTDVLLGAAMLRLAGDLAALVDGGSSVRAALDALRSRHDERAWAALQDFAHVQGEAGTARIDELAVGVIIAQDVRTRAGVLVLAKGRELDKVLLERLRNFARGGAILEPIQVFTGRRRDA